MSSSASTSITRVDPSIFKAYDIRGIVDRTLTGAAARAIGAALGSEAADRGLREIAVGRDGRLSGPALRDALIDGIRSTGTGVVDIGMVATPMLYYATFHLGTQSGVEITGSHNPPEYNGLKIVLGGDALYGDGLQRLRQRIATGELRREVPRLADPVMFPVEVRVAAGDSVGL